jgi:hypothetical protein
LAYGIICGWWAALYVGRVLPIDLFSVVPVVAGYLLIGMLEIPFNLRWAYRDPPSSADLAYVSTIVLAGVMFASPVILNWGIREMERRISTIFDGRTRRSSRLR